MDEFRIERDSMGEMRVPANAYYGASTARAVDNFPISGIRFPRRFIRAMALIKRAAAETNHELGFLDTRIKDAIVAAANEVAEGKLDDHFVLDIFQTGSGTSTNMNANEVIANRATEILGGARGTRLVHPNDHVNMGQSSNDVIPTAIHIAAREALETELVPALQQLQLALAEKAKAFDKIVKIGRTHLMDATPVRLGQEFGGYTAMAGHNLKRAKAAGEALAELPLGGTAVGTGINTHEEFSRRAIARLSEWLGVNFREAEDHFEAQGSKDGVVEASSQLKAVATSLMKVANDIRWLSSGPRCGIGEILLPAVQPGSSIMPGKVNPVMSEALMMVCAQVIGGDLAVSIANTHGNFELNVMMPVMAHNLLTNTTYLANAVSAFATRCVMGIEANVARCESMVEQSMAMVTSLAPIIGYDDSAKIAKESWETGKTVRTLSLEHGIDKDVVAKALDPWTMTEPGLAGGKPGGGGG